MDSEEKSFKEKRIRNLTHLYYSRPEIQTAIFKFSKNREISPRYFDGFGKRPDTFEYKGDIFELVKKGATSFHCSEELWKTPLDLSTDLNEKQLNELRMGWDFLLDIDSKYIDYSKIMAKQIIHFLNFHGIKNIGIKFSVTGDTPILIKNEEGEINLKPISEVIDLIKKGKKIYVLSLNKQRKLKLSKIYNFLEHKDLVYELNHSQSTIPVKLTGHHSVFIWDKGDLVEKKVSEIKTGEFLVSFNSEKNPLSEDKLQIINSFELNKNQHSKSKFTKKIKVTSELMRLIGYFLAEGHVTNVINQTGFTFNRNEENYIADVKTILANLTGRKISIRHPNPNSTQILIHSKEWATFFDNFCGKKKDKHLPSFSWKLSKELFLEMLRGYIRGDGYKIGKYGIVIKSVSKRLITEFVWLSKLNGISCNISSEQNKPHKLPQGNRFKGSLVYLLRIPKSELVGLEFHRERNKFSPFAGDKVFPTDGLKLVYNQIKPKMFNSHRTEQMTLNKKRANLDRIRKVLDWFYNFKKIDFDNNSKQILKNYEKLFSSDIAIIEIGKIIKKEQEKVYDVSVEETESFFGNYYPILLHNSGSKGFHLIVPWKAFPPEVNGVKTSDMFPKWPRILLQYINQKINPLLVKEITKITLGEGAQYVRDYEASKEVIPDLILVSPRHLFRMPYSLHEKTSLASIVLDPKKIENFELKDADPMKITAENIQDFTPDSQENEAAELLMHALDWAKQNEIDNPEEAQSVTGKYADFKPLELKNLTEDQFPPCIKNILKGVGDGKKRALFALINLFRSVGMDKVELEKKIFEWNEKNEVPLKKGYIVSQLQWTYRKKPIMPPNCKEFYQGIACCTPDGLCPQIKNPVNYVVRRNYIKNPPKKIGKKMPQKVKQN